MRTNRTTLKARTSRTSRVRANAAGSRGKERITIVRSSRCVRTRCFRSSEKRRSTAKSKMNKNQISHSAKTSHDADEPFSSRITMGMVARAAKITVVSLRLWIRCRACSLTACSTSRRSYTLVCSCSYAALISFIRRSANSRNSGASVATLSGWYCCAIL